MMHNQIRVYRARFQVTQEELARRMGVTRQTILAIEKNKYNPSLELGLRLAAEFKVSVEELFQLDSSQNIQE